MYFIKLNLRLLPKSGIASLTWGNVSATKFKNTVRERRIVTPIKYNRRKEFLVRLVVCIDFDFHHWSQHTNSTGIWWRVFFSPVHLVMKRMALPKKPVAYFTFLAYDQNPIDRVLILLSNFGVKCAKKSSFLHWGLCRYLPAPSILQTKPK